MPHAHANLAAPWAAVESVHLLESAHVNFITQ